MSSVVLLLSFLHYACVHKMLWESGEIVKPKIGTLLA